MTVLEIYDYAWVAGVVLASLYATWEVWRYNRR
jgi:hypothetical protein